MFAATRSLPRRSDGEEAETSGSGRSDNEPAPPNRLSVELDGAHCRADVRAISDQLVVYPCRLPLHLDPATVSRGLIRIYGVGTTSCPWSVVIQDQIHGTTTRTVLVPSALSDLRLVKRRLFV